MPVLPTITVSYGSPSTNLIDVETIDYSLGKRNVLDPVQPQTLSIASGMPSSWTTPPQQKDEITITFDGVTIFTGIISDVEVQYGFTTAEDKAFISAEGFLTQVARRNLNNVSFTQNTTGEQFNEMMIALGIPAYSFDNGYSTASAQTFSGNAMDFLNTLSSTEVGRVQDGGGEVFFIERGNTDDSASIQFSDTPADWATFIRYESVRFGSSSENYFTRVRIAPLGLAVQTESSGTAPFYELSLDSYDFSATQADEHARYLLNRLADANDFILEVRFKYQAQANSTMKDKVRTAIRDVIPIGQEVTVKFRGDTYLAICEGAQVSIDLEDVFVTYFLSPQDLNSYLVWGSGKFYNKWGTNKWGF